MPNQQPNSKFSVIVFIVLSVLWGLDGDLRCSIYYDSNIAESLSNPAASMGGNLRSNLDFMKRWRRLSTHGNFLTQAEIDGNHSTESKLLIDSGLKLDYIISTSNRLAISGNHFRKVLYRQDTAYYWTDLMIEFEHALNQKWYLASGLSRRNTQYPSLDSLYFNTDQGFLNLVWRPGNSWLIEGGFHLWTTTYHSYPAWINVAGSLIPSSNDQEDYGRIFSLHLRQQDKSIKGLSLAYTTVNSNSDTGEYVALRTQVYWSWRMRERHLVYIMLQGSTKEYRHNQLSGITSYRDPEERIQNRMHVLVERKISATSYAFIQASYLANEVTLNQYYYNKVLVETGIKFTF